MFTDSISDIELTSPAADRIFSNLTYNISPQLDFSFLATLRALLYPRARGSYLEFDAYPRRYRFDSLSSIPSSTLMVGLGHVSAELHDEGEELKDVELYLFQQTKVASEVFIFPSVRSTVVLVSKFDLRWWHLLQSVVPRLLPWYFNDTPLTEVESSLLKSLTLSDSTNYKKIITQISEQMDLRTEMIRETLKPITGKFYDCKLQRLQLLQEQERDRIKDLEHSLQMSYERLTSLAIEELGVREHRQQNDTTDTEIVEYFIHNKSLTITKTNSESFYFVVSTTLNSWDPDMCDRLISNVGVSCLYRDTRFDSGYASDGELSEYDKQRLLSEIFVRETIKIRVCAQFHLDYGANSITCGSISGELIDYETRVPNPHINYYSCLGNNAAAINKAVSSSDYVSAVALCCAAASNINLAESSTVSRLMSAVYDPNKTYLELPDGSIVNAIDAVKWIKETNRD